MKNKDNRKPMTIRIPESLHRKLSIMRIDGEIESINQAVEDALVEKFGKKD